MFFREATHAPPFPFQREFATANEFPPLVNIPTGLGKTAMAIVGWLWRRFGAGDGVRRETPRRLVYCLPMRVLVEQTRDNAAKWVGRLRNADYLQCDVRVHVLMGGEDEDDWDIYPEREAIIIGTQDMLLSRALNRGYAASRARWPMQFGLLHTDCLWVFDEIQLMGSGLATTAQLEAFRRLLPRADAETAKEGQGCRSVWMSATLRPEWLGTVDFKKHIDEQGPIERRAALSLSAADPANQQVNNRWNAPKPLSKASSGIDDPAALAEEVREAHKDGTRTICIVNTVERAIALFGAMGKASAPSSAKKGKATKSAGRVETEAGAPRAMPNLVLLHSRFRPPDRARRVADALADVAADGPGTIVVSTQVIEAGVDVSATTLFTELAPWASLVQRFGRCNRRGEQNEHACVRWIDVREEEAAPYDPEDLKKAREALKAIGEKPVAQRSVSLAALSELDVKLPFNHTHVIRRRDLIDLFDTTPDLAGNDIDIDRFVREVEDSDVRVFWRAWDRPKGHEPPPKDGPAPRREELCPAPIGAFRDFAKKHAGQVWRWNYHDKTWEKVDSEKITPGQVYVVHANAGGYSAERGWDPKATAHVDPIPPEPGKLTITPDATDDDAPSQIGVWQSIEEHTNDVCNELEAIVRALPLGEPQLAGLRAAARWHDRGKVHPVFQNAIDDGQIVDRPRGAVTRRSRPERWRRSRVIAKAPGKQWTNGQLADAGWWRRYDWPDGGRKHFRHELASALAVLQRPHGTLKALSDEDLNLVAYLVATHHGKVRLSIRSLPNEMRPGDGNGDRAPQKRFARGVWDGDVLPATDLGGDITAPEVTLSLEPMELGLCEQPPFAGQPSWAERMLRLRDTLGPFRLAYLEAILRAADMRASIAADRPATAEQAAAGPISSSAGASGKEGANG